MSKKNKKTFEEQLQTGLGEWTDEECLTYFMQFFDRVSVGSNLIGDEHGFLTHEVIIFRSGDKVVISEPNPLDWPLEPVIAPELDLDNKRTIN